MRGIASQEGIFHEVSKEVSLEKSEILTTDRKNIRSVLHKSHTASLRTECLTV